MHIAVSAFPPSFDGNPLTYGVALFSLTLVSAMSLAQLLHDVFDFRRHREISRLIANALPPPPPAPMTTLTSFRRIIACFLVMAFSGAAPDAVILFLWGEASEGTMEWLFLVDRLGDGFTMVPFCAALWLLARTRQALPQQLAKAAMIPLGPFHWSMLRDSAKIAGVVLFIAVGVTLGKAGA